MRFRNLFRATSGNSAPYYALQGEVFTGVRSILYACNEKFKAVSQAVHIIILCTIIMINNNQKWVFPSIYCIGKTFMITSKTLTIDAIMSQTECNWDTEMLRKPDKVSNN